MEIMDIVLLAIIGVFGLAGFFFGFIHALGSLFGTIVGVYLATRYYNLLADWLIKITGWEGNIVRVIMFIIAFLIITRLVGIMFFFMEKIFGILNFVPFVKTFNRLLGLFLGFAEGIISVGFVIFFIERFPLSERFMANLIDSVVAMYASQIASILWPLLPEAFKLLQSSVDYVENFVK